MPFSDPDLVKNVKILGNKDRVRLTELRQKSRSMN